MKKFLVVLFLMFFLKPSLTLSATEDNVIYSQGDKTITIVYKDETQWDFEIFLNTKQSVSGSNSIDRKIKFCEGFGLNKTLYNTNNKNIKVISYDYNDAGYGQEWWCFINLITGDYFYVISDGYASQANDSGVISIKKNEKPEVLINPSIENKNCNKSKVNSELSAKKASPRLNGFMVDNKLAYKTQPSAPLNCIFDYKSHVLFNEDIKKEAIVDSSHLGFDGFSRDMGKVHFSFTGKGWKSYYIFDIKTKKIVKGKSTNLLKLTPIKKFGQDVK